MATAIEFNNISKQYRLGVVSGGTIRADFQRWWQMTIRHQEDPFLRVGETNDRSVKGNSEYVWALKDIDFKVEQGDVVGIIGKNGAGKSTLLKILSKVTGPTTGTIRAKGRIGSLLEVGTGFHPEMTGRENIYLNGAILGMSKQEINRKLDEIVDFSGCERYIDTPVKRYSSGMMVRLGFAVAAHLDPEILVVDEVLAVGDAEFQKKAIGKMQDVSKGEGRTVLFVSHNMASIKKLCNRGVLLEQGRVKMIGEINEVVDEYIGDGVVGENQYYDDKEKAPGNDVIRLKTLEVLPQDNSREISIETGVQIRLAFWCEKPNAMLDVNMKVCSLDDTIICQAGQMLGKPGCKDSKVGIYTVEFVIPAYTLNAGKYKASFFFGENQRYVVFSGIETQFTIENSLSDMGFNQAVMPGVLRLKNSFSISFQEEV